MKGLYLILLSFLFGCNLPDMQPGRRSHIILINQRRYGKKLCLWETAVSV